MRRGFSLGGGRGRGWGERAHFSFELGEVRMGGVGGVLCVRCREGAEKVGEEEG